MNEKQRLPTQPAAAGANPELWPPGFGAWIKIGVVYQKASQRLATSLRPLELTVAQFDALANLYVEDRISQQLLAQRLLVTKGNVSGLVDRLAARGLVERRDDPEDGRAHKVVLTRSGKRVARKALEVQRALVDAMMAPLERSEREQLRAMLERVVGQLDAAP